jgi:hypothetical protein
MESFSFDFCNVCLILLLGDILLFFFIIFTIFDLHFTPEHIPLHLHFGEHFLNCKMHLHLFRLLYFFLFFNGVDWPHLQPIAEICYWYNCTDI